MEAAKFKAALVTKSLDATNSMIELIEKGRDQNTLLYVSLTVRFGADVHTRVGYLRVICWAWSLLDEVPTIRNSIVALCIVSDLSVLKDDSGFTELTVGDWLESQGFTLSNIPPEHMAMIRVLLDEYEPISHELFIKALTDKSVEQFDVNTRSVVSNEPWMVMDMAWAVQYYNAPVFHKVVDMVGCPYPTLNILLLFGKDNVEYQRMLVACVDAGIEFDIHQIAILMAYPEKALQTIQERYEKPLWKKACSTQGAQRTLGKWNKLLLSAGLPLENTCSFTKTSNEEYSDLYQVKYRDNEGVWWRFPSTLYVSILETRVNPANLRTLPESVLETIAFRLKLLDSLGLSPASPITIEDALKQLHKPEKLFESHTPIPQASERLRKLSVRLEGRKELEMIMEKQGIRVMLSTLTPSHCIATILWIVDWYRNHRGNIQVVV